MWFHDVPLTDHLFDIFLVLITPRSAHVGAKRSFSRIWSTTMSASSPSNSYRGWEVKKIWPANSLQRRVTRCLFSFSRDVPMGCQQWPLLKYKWVKEGERKEVKGKKQRGNIGGDREEIGEEGEEEEEEGGEGGEGKRQKGEKKIMCAICWFIQSSNPLLTRLQHWRFSKKFLS